METCAFTVDALDSYVTLECIKSPSMNNWPGLGSPTLLTEYSSSVLLKRYNTKRKVKHMQKSKQTVVCCTRCYYFLISCSLYYGELYRSRMVHEHARLHSAAVAEQHGYTCVARSTMASHHWLTHRRAHRATLCNRNNIHRRASLQDYDVIKNANCTHSSVTTNSYSWPAPNIIFCQCNCPCGIAHSCVIQMVHTKVYSVQHVDYLNVRSLATVSPHNL